MSAGFSSSDHRLMPPQLNLSDQQQQQLATLTRRFSRSASLQQHPSFTFKENRVFSGVPELTIDWPDYTHSAAHSPPPFINTDEDAWNLFYAAAGHVAKMQIKMSSRSIAGVSPHLSRSDELELLRQQHFCRNRGVSAWPPLQLQNQPLHHRRKPPVAGGSNTAAKECAGTGVFLPRRYSDNPPESRKRQACWPPNLPARMTQSSSTGPPQIQAQTNDSFISHCEMLTGQRKAMILAAQQQHRRRSNIDGVVMERAANNPDVLLPQEWTY